MPFHDLVAMIVAMILCCILTISAFAYFFWAKMSKMNSDFIKLIDTVNSDFIKLIDTVNELKEELRNAKGILVNLNI